MTKAATNFKFGEGIVLALGLLCTGEGVDWSLVSGTVPEDIRIMKRDRLSIPRDRRHKQLSWVGKEVAALLTQLKPDLVAIREAQVGPSHGPSIERIQVEGVVMAAVAASHLDLVSFHSATMAKAAKPLGGEEAFIEAIPDLTNVPKSRRVPCLMGAYAVMGHGLRR